MTGLFTHTSVLRDEAIMALKIVPGSQYIDATLGGAGHTKEIIARGGTVLGIDADLDAVNHVTSLNLSGLTVVHGYSDHIADIAEKERFEEVAGILFDLGMSSHQLEESGRGFTFQNDEPLDMRMNTQMQVTAADLVNGLGKKELYELFSTYGEEPLARLYSAAIVDARRIKPITTTGELVKVLERVAKQKRVQGRKQRHPATRVFQALRTAVNDELTRFDEALKQSVELLQPGGRIVIISFHSLEDRIAKMAKQYPSLMPVGGLVLPSSEEVARNPRASSAKMRVYEKTNTTTNK